MSEEPVSYGDNVTPVKSCIIINHGSWNFKLFKKQRRLSIETLDYHAGPLELTRDELIDLARKMGLRVRTRKKRTRSQKDT